MGCQELLQGIFPTQGWNLCLLSLLHKGGGRSFTTSTTWGALCLGPILELRKQAQRRYQINPMSIQLVKWQRQNSNPGEKG